MAYHSAGERNPPRSFWESPQANGHALWFSNEHHLCEFGRGYDLHDWEKDSGTGMKKCREDGTNLACPAFTGILRQSVIHALSKLW